MKITRRKAIELAVAAAVVEQSAVAQQATPMGLKWLEAAPPVASGVSWGVPFPRGAVSKAQTFALTAGGTPLPLQQWPLAYWPDGSMKFIGFAASVPANTTGDLRLAPGQPATGALKIEHTAGAIVVDTGAVQCSIPTQGSNLIASIMIGDRELANNGRLVCTLDDGRRYVGETKAVTQEQSGPVRACVRIEGVHKAVDGPHEWLPFTVRLYFYAGQEKIRLVHSIVFDGDQEKDFIKGLGLEFAVPMREQVHNRHVQFTGDDEGVWAEPLQPLTGRRVLGPNLFAQQLGGERIPNKETFGRAGQKLMTDWAVWDSYKLVQPTADGFIIQKRTNPKSCWVDAAWGRRASGLVFAGDVSGGLAVGIKNMWQSYPASLEVRNGRTNQASLHVWLWSPDAAAMDLRHYDVVAHDLDSSYEDVQPGFSTAHGVGRTSEMMLFPSVSVPSHAEAVHNARLTQHPPLLVASPEYLHSAKVFGIWSLPDRSTPAKKTLEDHLDAAFDVYHKEVEQRHWYGFWNYGDVMHQHDGPRHSWRYDVGGFAWDNTELGTDMWLWYSFLRTGRVDMFRMAEAMTRHTSEVDTYHLGPFAGLGSRHNVRHWGCGAKEARISQAAYRRMHYYLTTDERVGDLMRAEVDVDFKALEIDPMRLASPRTPDQTAPARIRGGPDWLAFIGNWMTEWERTGQTKYRDKILAGMDSIVAMPYGFLTGPNQLYGYDPKTGKMDALVKDGLGTYNLATIMGGGEVVFELNELIDHPGWKKAWLQYCRLHTAPKAVVARDNSTGTEGTDGQYARPGRLSAYLYRETKNPAYAKKAWAGVRVPTYATTHFEGPVVLEAIDEIPGLSTNSTAQGCLEAIEVLEMCGDLMS